MKILVKKAIFFALTVSLLTACSKHDEAPYIPPVIEGSQTVNMGVNFDNQIFISLADQKIISVPVINWDLAFQSKGGTAIRVNSGKKSSVYNSNSTDFASVTAAPDAKYFVYDAPEALGNPLTTAIGEWTSNGQSKNLVYIVNLGNNPPLSVNPIGYIKLQVQGYHEGKYAVKYANLDGTNEKTVEIPVNANTNYTYYSLDKGMVSIEPDKNNWDITFVGVTTPGGGPQGSFVVSAAVICNTLNGILVAQDNPGKDLADSDLPDAPINQLPDNVSNYAGLGKDDFNRLGPTNNPIVMGRDWYQIIKPHGDGIYKIYNWKTYIIKSVGGKFFKLRFTAYKSVETGEKGAPSFEYKELQ
jgi:hypothetical protein